VGLFDLGVYNMHKIADHLIDWQCLYVQSGWIIFSKRKYFCDISYNIFPTTV